jgi:hypothetical protein
MAFEWEQLRFCKSHNNKKTPIVAKKFKIKNVWSMKHLILQKALNKVLISTYKKNLMEVQSAKGQKKLWCL